MTGRHHVDVINNACGVSIQLIDRCLPLLGFLLRSTNVRNSFEVYRPLRQLRRRILGPVTRLVLSSEWEFSPYVFKKILELPDYVLIGLPAQESGNPLLVPLAGHELGHTVWAKELLVSQLLKDIEDTTYSEIQNRASEYSTLKFQGNPNDRTDLFVKSVVATIVVWSCSQAEESFCDFIGLKIFSEAYLYAFAYLLSPGTGQRSFFYPNTKRRVENLSMASRKFGVTIPTDYDKAFMDSKTPSNPSELFLVTIADKAVQQIIPKVIDKANEVIVKAGVVERSKEKVQEAVRAFHLLIPATNSMCISNILNAGWVAYHDQNLWKESPHLGAVRNAILNELILKSIEVFDIEEIEAGS